MRASYLQVGPGGICFAHGPYTEQNCPQWKNGWNGSGPSTCLTDPKKDEYIQMAKRQVSIPELERAVVDAGIAWRESNDNDMPTYTALIAAVDALLKARASG